MVTTAGDWRGALLGAMISGIFGVAWSQWGASGLSGTTSVAIRMVGVAVGLLVVVWAAFLRRSASAGAPAPGGPSRTSSKPMFALPSYLLVVAVEVVAIGGGNGLLRATGHQDYTIAWVAIVVGLHFLAFGRLFFAGFYLLGSALIAAGIAGAIVGVSGGGIAGIEAVSGLLAATSLFVAGGWTVMGARAGAHL